MIEVSLFLVILFTIFEITFNDHLIYTMLKDNPLFSEDALMKAASCLGTDSWMFFPATALKTVRTD